MVNGSFPTSHTVLFTPLLPEHIYRLHLLCYVYRPYLLKTVNHPIRGYKSGNNVVFC